MPESEGAATRRVPPEIFPPLAGFLEAFGLVTSSNRSTICVFLDATAERMPCDLDHRPRAGEFDGSRPKRMSPAREVRARPLLRLLELGAMASSSALASEAVCLNASRILAGRDRGDERQNHNDNPGHRCRLSVHENVGDLGKNSGTEPRPVGSPRGPRFSRARARWDVTHDTPPGGPAPDGRSRRQDLRDSTKMGLTVEPPGRCIIQGITSMCGAIRACRDRREPGSGTRALPQSRARPAAGANGPQSIKRRSTPRPRSSAR